MTAIHASGARRETLAVRVLGALAAMASGPLWAMGITWTVVRVNDVAASDIESSGRLAYSLFWFSLTCLLFFGTNVGYVIARLSHLTVLWSLLALHAALVTLATVTVFIAILR
jgi:hypothetical protein